MSVHRKSWNVRAAAVSIGYLEYTTMPNFPGNSPNPKASSPYPGANGVETIPPKLFRSKPEWMPVFDGAMNEYGYSIGAAPFCETSR